MRGILAFLYDQYVRAERVERRGLATQRTRAIPRDDPQRLDPQRATHRAPPSLRYSAWNFGMLAERPPRL